MRLRRIALILVPAAMAVWGIVAGCSPNKSLGPNVPPETSLFIQGPIDTVSGGTAPVDTVNHVVHLYWFGSDPDGIVVRFEYRFIFTGEDPDTVSWHGILDNDHIFTIPTPTGYTMPKFEIRAVDNDSLRDATPASQDFQFSNLPPTVKLIGSPPVPPLTWASVTVRWSAADPDGDAAKMSFRLWLDGREAQAHVLPPGSSEYTFPSDDFRNASGDMVSGDRTLFIQAIDDGGRAGTPATATWFVRAPEGAKVLVVDDLPSTATGYSPALDDFYRTALMNAIPGQYQILDLQTQSPFRSAKDFEQTLKLFPAVMWFREINPSFSNLLHDYESAIPAYLAAGPNSFFITGVHLFTGDNPCGGSATSTNCGFFSLALAQQILDTDDFYKAAITGRTDLTVSWTPITGRKVFLPLYKDSLTTRGGVEGVRGFVVRSPSSAAVIAPPNTLNQVHPYEMPIGVRVVQPNGAKAIFYAFPLSSFSLQSGRNERIIQKLLNDMLLNTLP